MSEFKQESHLRSLIKGISWRIVATVDTILVVLIVTCFFGKCSIEFAFSIAFIEFFLKLLVYYFHERIWQSIRKRKITQSRTLYKTISWRILATTMTFIISGTVLDSFDEIAMAIAIVELFTKFIFYYLHERLWLQLPLGKIRNYFFKKK